MGIVTVSVFLPKADKETKVSQTFQNIYFCCLITVIIRTTPKEQKHNHSYNRNVM